MKIMQFKEREEMSNARFSILQAVAVSDRRVSDAQFRTLAALGMYADKNGWCFPSLKTLAADLKKSPQAVGRDTIALRKLGYLEVKNRYDAKTKSRHSNLYRLKYDLPDFNMGDTPLSTLVVDTLSTPDVELNDLKNAPINCIPLSIENAIYAGVEVTKEMVQTEELRNLAPRMFEKALGFSKPLPWWQGKEWTAFGEWVCKRYAESKTCFGEYNIWRATPYTKGAMANTRIRLSTIEFMDSWDMFQMSKKGNKPDELQRNSMIRTIGQ